MTARVLIFDTTLRDGEQAPGNSLSVEEKVRLARQLEVLGVDVIEAGFPASSDTDFRSVLEIAGAVRRPVIAALARCTERDIDLAGDAIRGAVRGRIHVFLSTSDLHLAAKLRMSRDEALERIALAVRRARRFTDDVEWSAEDASRSDLDFLCQCVELAVAEGATTINLPDTVGFATPDEYAQMFREVARRVPSVRGVTLSAHCHDDLGLAVANSLAAIAAGARQVECTINGIGERAGNAALEEIVMAGRVRASRLGFECNIESRELFRTSQLLSHQTGIFPQPNKAVVGRNAFAHEAGIHQHGMLQNGLTYEIMQPETVGIARSSLVLGRHSGRHALARRFTELGYDIDDQRLGEVYQAFLRLADRKRQILDEDLIALLHESFHDAPEAFQLRALRVVCGSVTPSATVTLAGPGSGERTATGSGDGPIAAAFAAVSEIVGRTVEVESLNLRSVTPGRDSVGQVFLQVRVDGRTFSAHSASTDIVEGCARALVNALNKARHAEVLEGEAMESANYWGV
jgi:2-isopropylmalate synthase